MPLPIPRQLRIGAQRILLLLYNYNLLRPNASKRSSLLLVNGVDF